MSPESPIRSPGPRRRRAAIYLGIGVILLLTILFAEQAFNLRFVQPNTSGETLIFAALSALVFLLFIALSFVLVRTLLKLYAERRVGTLGSKFRTKMVLGALVLSLGPVIFLFMFAYGLMNRSIEKWFSTPVEEVRNDTATLGNLLSDYAQQNAQGEADSIAMAESTHRAFEAGNFGQLLDVLRRRQSSLQGGFALAMLDGELEASFAAPANWPALKEKLGIQGNRLPATAGRLQLNGLEYILASSRVGDHGLILVAMPLPPNFTSAMQQIENSQRRYLELSRERKIVRRTYMLLLLLLTVLVLFAATWFALFLSKFVVRPVAALAEATQEIAKGNLDYRVDVPAADELGRLVASFNQMAADLASSRRQLEASSIELAEANVELEQRRQHIETVLENIPTGVLSLDAGLRVTRANPALIRMFRPERAGNGNTLLQGAHLRDLFPQEVLDDLAHMIRKADRMGTATSQLELTVDHQPLNLAATVASLKHGMQRLGYIIVLEDLSDLLKAQKQAAWREVARRVAHEIKNPLTPIALSAQRIKRHLDRGGHPDDASLAVIHGCAETIAGAVETVRSLVDEFATLARFPASAPRPADINEIVQGALNMFDGRLEGIRVRKELAPDLPKVMADPESMKRAIANLVDNAAEAMQDSLVKEVEISTMALNGSDLVEVVVADTGQGVTQEVKERLFLPYFTTRKRGSGLGLAIVSRIIEDHHGSIRVEENQPTGARFIVELPVASEAAIETPTHA
ncbi:MAG TPA: ATP-binding protein [Terriglobales bacterium]|nr:ATP-binding protein [Terriglobales bacterium]